MLESQRETTPRTDTGELDTAIAFLDFVRSCVLKKVDGLDDEQLRRRLVVSETTLLGLLQHLTDGERYWFGHVVTGDPTYADVDFGWVVPEDRTGAELVAGYRAAIEASNAAIRAVGDPAAAVAVPVDGEPKTLRWVLAHMTGEVSRHAGHADVLRELLDGTTGR